LKNGELLLVEAGLEEEIKLLDDTPKVFVSDPFPGRGAGFPAATFEVIS
jgi:hypothetical protein